MNMGLRFTEDWSTNGYQSLEPVRTGEGRSAQWVLPIQVSWGALILEATTQLITVFAISSALLFIGSALGLGKSMLLALCLPVAAFSAWTVWRCVRIPHRERVIVTREDDCLVVKHTPDNRSPIRLDLSQFRYAWLERQLRGGPVGWTIQFGSTPTMAEGVLDLRMYGIHRDLDHYSVYAMLLQQFVHEAFKHVEILYEASDSAGQLHQEDGRPVLEADVHADAESTYLHSFHRTKRARL